MRIPDAILAVRWLVRDTFRQALSSYLFLLLLGVSGLAVSCETELTRSPSFASRP